MQKANRCHFGTEFNPATSYYGLNNETFGNSKKSFSVEEMFRVNERLTGQKFEYDGNPHDFGKPTLSATTTINLTHKRCMYLALVIRHFSTPRPLILVITVDDYPKVDL
ncbi:hypothetical protein PsorP6_005913 [Peronosclerospora sorghi]|uniref:Uncharacterized protein n=1 Tax=Peronosclerospora sorghi TaxID=230839 RepID=A0ACC0W527_9STRA|nr:hypothetical protein PsorP6_005913 [Peronosclerospora sorghi]